ncbi:MAG TPA: DUF1707 domain-containing protein [Trebonia sp.]|jgi:hypothetical protein|nr:DUF1707 domain-containing protein [Trebonia sp.]
MTSFPASEFPASDAERDAAAEKLADAVASGRLSLADHEVRLEALFAARTQGELQAITADLPALPVRKSGLYRSADAHQCVVIGGTVQRTGRFTIGRFCTVTAAFGRVDLDLRAAVPTQREIEVAIWSVASRVSLTVPAWWGLSDKVLAIGMSQTIPDREADPGEHLLRLRGACIGGSFRVTQA